MNGGGCFLDPIYIESTFHIDQEKECGLTFVSSIDNCYFELHYHDFFELLLVTDGKLVNDVAGTSMLLEKGSLVFFRPEDIHQLRQYKDFDCRFINLTIVSKAVKELFHYMGEDIEVSRFVSSPLPPLLILSEGQLSEIESTLERLNTLPNTDKHLIRTTLRTILVEMYFRYLPLVWRKDNQVLPQWLTRLCEDSKEKEVFQEGVISMLRLTEKNHSYLCRTFKRYLNTTPTDYINDIRLNYAENLLLNSDLSILDICMETGFESLSHFYRLFTNKFSQTPYRYRKKHWNSLHKWS